MVCKLVGCLFVCNLFEERAWRGIPKVSKQTQWGSVIIPAQSFAPRSVTGWKAELKERGLRAIVVSWKKEEWLTILRTWAILRPRDSTRAAIKEPCDLSNGSGWRRSGETISHRASPWKIMKAMAGRIQKPREDPRLFKLGCGIAGIKSTLRKSRVGVGQSH